MPRPGQRPYECVRRAWHSERHHPIRGSLIQEIFRMSNEVHSSATRKNREWQEKLPIVVLKAEEIMYSKANSEAEYSDLNTLWARVTDAINTIIRSDESTENGGLLQPCIEAALHLGCTPRRSSRSQRNESPRCYLRTETPNTSSVLPTNSNNAVYGNHTTPDLMLHYSRYLTHFNTDFPRSYSKAEARGLQSRDCNNTAERLPILVQNFVPIDKCSVYPLYYDNQAHLGGSKFCTMKPSNSNVMEVDKLGVHCELDASSRFPFPANHERSLDKGHGTKCDLTLRLGSLVVPCANMGNSWPLEKENGSKEKDLSFRRPGFREL